MKLLLTCFAFVLMAFGFAQTARPKVAIIPLLNQSGEKWEELKSNQIKKATEYLTTEFGKRGFDLIPAEKVRAAIIEKKLDFEDEENQRKAVMYDLGKTLEADYVFFAVITQTDQKKQKRVFYHDTEGEATGKVWFLDVKAEQPIVSGKTFVSRSGGERLSFDHKGSDRQIQAAANVMRDALAEFFKSHPISK